MSVFHGINSFKKIAPPSAILAFSSGQKKPVATKPAALQLVYQYDISLEFNDEQATLLFLAISDQELLKDYIKTLDLQYYGQSPSKLFIHSISELTLFLC
jgi:hypothetical protein